MRAVLQAAFGLALLVAFTDLGALGHRLGVALPTAVIGLVLFAVVMAISERAPMPAFRWLAFARRAATPVSRRLISHMGLLFVPAGVGVITQVDLLRREWAPVAAGLVGSTLAALAVTGWLMHRLERRGSGEPSP